MNQLTKEHKKDKVKVTFFSSDDKESLETSILHCNTHEKEFDSGTSFDEIMEYARELSKNSEGPRWAMLHTEKTGFKYIPEK